MLPERTPPRHGPIFLLATGLSLWAAGCAGIVPAPSSTTTSSSSSSSSAAVSSPGITDPDQLRADLRHPEDSLVLDLLLGYRQRELGLADPDIEHRARSARQQLEYMLRHGGVKERGGEGTVIRTGDGDPVTLRAAVDQMSDALLHNTPGTAWRPEAERAREVQRHRPALSRLVEDAEWVLTLATALESLLPESDKRRLRELHEAYAASAPHSEIAARAQTLLASVQEERLRREIKKLANRSWERERRARTASEENDTAPGTGATAPAPPRAVPPPTPPSIPSSSVPPAAPAFPAPTPPGLPSGDMETPASVDAPPDTLTTPERYCANRRTEAAQAFAAARGATDATEKDRLLRQSLASLDDCLQRHPNTPEAEKARQNRARVEQELAR